MNKNYMLDGYQNCINTIIRIELSSEIISSLWERSLQDHLIHDCEQDSGA